MRFSEIGLNKPYRAILGVLHILSKIHCKLNGKYGKSMSRHGLHGLNGFSVIFTIKVGIQDLNAHLTRLPNLGQSSKY